MNSKLSTSLTWLRPALYVLPWVLAFTPVTVTAKIKCWTNKEGARECGNRVPPEYSQQGHEIRNKSGFLIEESERALTPEETAEKLKKEAIRKEQDALLEDQKRRDRVLLDTFFEERDIIRARDDKIGTVISSIRLENDRIGKLKKNLEALKKREEQYLDDDKEVPERVTKNIQELEQQIGRAQQYILDKDKEKQRIEKTYTDYIKRFRELSAAKTGTAP